MIKLWDKKEAINGVSAEDYLKDTPKIDGEMLLVLNDKTGTIEQVLHVEILREMLALDNTVEPLDVGKAYLDSLQPVNIPVSYTQRIDELENALIELASMLGGAN